eukprot:s271_g20.t1
MLQRTGQSLLVGLKQFRHELLEHQALLLSKLDAKISNLALVASESADIELEEFKGSKEEMQSTLMSVPASAWHAPNADGVAGVAERKFSAIPGSVVEDTVEAFASLPTVAERRKKHMAWIHKQSQFESDKPEDEKNEQQQRVFSQLSAECAREAVRRKAIDNFGPPRPPSSSRWAELVRHPHFERMSLAMIYLNAVWIAVDIEFNKADMALQAESPFLIMEIVFTLYFSGELFVRFMSYERRREAVGDSWFIFDLLLVVMMLLETWLIPLTAFIIEGGFTVRPQDEGANLAGSASVLRIARILRVFRTARIIRVARYMPELMILVKGLIVAARSVFFTLVLLLLITYVFSIAFSQLSENTRLEPKYFPTMPSAVLTLIVQCVMPDQEEFFQDVSEVSWVMGMLVIIFVLVGSLIVMNMLVWDLNDVMQSLFEIAGTEDIPTLFEMLDYDGGGTLETDEFCEGIFKASTSTKPLELDRLMKQCRDILGNSRKALDILYGDGEGGTAKARKSKRRSDSRRRVHSSSTDHSGSGGSAQAATPRSALAARAGDVFAAQDSKHVIASMESRVEALEQMALNMQRDTEKILEMLRLTKPRSPRPREPSNFKRAKGVCRGRSHDEPIECPPFPPDERPPSPLMDSGNRLRKKPPIVYSWSGNPPLDDDEVVQLRRRVAQLEAELRKQQMERESYMEYGDQ